MLNWNSFKCHLGQKFGKIENVIEGPGSYSLLWCPIKNNYINNCDNCDYNEVRKTIKSDPNNYLEWLRLKGDFRL